MQIFFLLYDQLRTECRTGTERVRPWRSGGNEERESDANSGLNHSACYCVRLEIWTHEHWLDSRDFLSTLIKCNVRLRTKRIYNALRDSKAVDLNARTTRWIILTFVKFFKMFIGRANKPAEIIFEPNMSAVLTNISVTTFSKYHYRIESFKKKLVAISSTLWECLRWDRTHFVFFWILLRWRTSASYL